MAGSLDQASQEEGGSVAAAPDDAALVVDWGRR